MEHGKKNRKFGRETKQRMAFMRSLAHGLISAGKITTTEARAKSLRGYMEKLISRGRKGDLVSVKLLTATVGAKTAQKLIKDIAPRFKARSGGYIRIIKLPPRVSDGSKMAAVEFTE